jgi:carotenoid cleavage dioxygenase-like enzyme
VAARYRYAYIADNSPQQPIGLQQRITRVDLESDQIASHDFAPHGYPGEPLFIPARPTAREDDGYIVTLVFDASEGRTRIVGLDARGYRCTTAVCCPAQASRPVLAARYVHAPPVQPIAAAFMSHGRKRRRASGTL